MIGGFGSFPGRGTGPRKKSKLGVTVKVRNRPALKAKSGLGVNKSYGLKKPKTPSFKKKDPPLHFARRDADKPAKPIHEPPPVPSRPPGGPRRTGIAIVGQFTPWPWGQHPDEAYMADAIESLGIPVYRIRQDWQCSPVNECDHVLFTGQPDSWGRIPKWSSTHKTILWTLDWLPDYPDRHGIIQAARRATYFVSSDQFDWKSRYGIRNHIYLPGACESARIPFDPRPDRPCAFMGSLYNERRTRIAKIIKKLGGTVLDSPGSWIYGEKLARFVQSTKVVVGDNARNDVPGYWSSRNYVIPGAGGFLLTSSVPGLEKDFEFGKHIAVYDGIDALEEAIKTCLDLASEREEIRRAGFDHVHRNHSWTSRAQTLLQCLKINVEK